MTKKQKKIDEKAQYIIDNIDLLPEEGKKEPAVYVENEVARMKLRIKPPHLADTVVKTFNKACTQLLKKEEE